MNRIKNSKPIRVLQVIDSLEIGGAEKMAVQLANSLSRTIACSALCCTRKAGPLKNEIEKEVKYIELNRKYALDIPALFRLRKFVKTYDIKIIHAHGSSFFIACLLKILCPKLKLVWHDHFGLERNEKKSIKDYILVLSSSYFDQIIVVKKELKFWALENLKCNSVELINNFSSLSISFGKLSSASLKGDMNSIKIIHTANFRPQKDHLTGLRAILMLKEDDLNISYHLFGSYKTDDAYFKKISGFIKDNHIEDMVFVYGSKKNISDYLQIADIGILTSTSEGMPLSLIEYAFIKLPIVVSNVGECKSLVSNHAKTFEPEDHKTLYKHLKELISNRQLADKNAEMLYAQVYKLYSEETVIDKFIFVYHSL
jgi:glycosyltransferase involved in cell wall biosynthesis